MQVPDFRKCFDGELNPEELLEAIAYLAAPWGGSWDDPYSDLESICMTLRAHGHLPEDWAEMIHPDEMGDYNVINLETGDWEFEDGNYSKEYAEEHIEGLKIDFPEGKFEVRKR